MPSATPTDDAAVLALRKEREEFEALVRENERLAAADPVAYRQKLRRLVALGYAYLGLMLSLALALVVGIAYLMMTGHHLSGGGVKVILFGLALLYAILRSLWVKIDRPAGFLLSKERFPKLWTEVEAIADRLKAPRPDEIRLDEEFNAAASQWPRFGILGGYRQTLLLGLPLLAGLSPDEARGVIAHEFGHFSGAHGRFGVWIYRVNRTWDQLGQNLAHSGWSGMLFKPFVDWFFPRFAATSFAIRRQHEFEADQAAAEVVGATTFANTLTRLSPLGEHLQNAFWKEYQRDCNRTGTPAPNFSSRIVASMRRPLDLEAIHRQLAFNLAQPTDYDDTHPSLTDRIASLGVPAPLEFPACPERSAADEFFGEALPALEKEFDLFYQQSMAHVWKALSERRVAMQRRIDELSKGESDGKLKPEEQVELIYLRTELDRVDDPIPVYRDLYARLPESADAIYLLGSTLLDRDEEEGVSLLELAVQKDAKFRDEVRGDLAAFYARQGQIERVATLRLEAQDAFDRAQIADSAIALNLSDDLLPPDLSPLEREKLDVSLKALKGLSHGYVFRKRMPATGELRHYLLLIPKKTAFVGEDPLGYFTKQLEKQEGPPTAFSVAVVPKAKPWHARLAELEGSLAFDAKAPDEA